MPRHVHAGGYTTAGAMRLQRVELPVKIKCAVCRKLKTVNFFSTIQQNVLKNAIAVGEVGDAAVENWIPCVSCTPKQVTELECCICEEVKGLNGFAKAQRRLGENARCITCVAELNGATPVDKSYRQHVIDELGEEDGDSDNDDYSVSNAHESSTFSETGSSAGVPLSSGSCYDLNQENLRSLNFSSDGHNSKPSASQAATSASVTATKRVRVAAGAGKWQNFAKENGGDSVGATTGAEFTGFDRDGKAHQMVRPASTAVSDDSDDGTIADPREQARNARAERDAQSRFAKIPGGRAVPVVVPTYVGGKTVKGPSKGYDDDGDDDEDWGTF